MKIYNLRIQISSALTLIVFCFLIACNPTKESEVNEQPDKSKTSFQQPTAAELDRGDIRFVFYNVENLFDTYDDTLKHDEEFLPWGIKAWNSERYNRKLKQIFKVLTNIGGWELPELIGLCEIENRFVLEELIKRTPLSRERYGIIHEESPDARGIDLGLLYRKDAFIPIKHEAIRIDFPFDSTYKTRDVIYVQGVINKRDTLNIFLCHFPSRRGGQLTSEPRRLFVAEQVRKKVNLILEENKDANIVITGDFNDEPTNRSIYEVLRGKGERENLEEGDLYNFMHYMKVKMGLGTYKYKAFWNMLDQFIVSQSLLSKDANVYTKYNSARIYMKSWLMEDDVEAPGRKPFRTYGGAYYYGGYSDHFPIFLDLFFNNHTEN